MAYWDTSCLLKLYAPEADSTLFKAHALLASTLTTADITRLELFAALQRKQAAGDLHAGGARIAIAAYDADVAAGLIGTSLLDELAIAPPDMVGEFRIGASS